MTTFCHNLNVSGNVHSKIMLFNLQCNFSIHCKKVQLLPVLAIYAHVLATVPAHHKPCHFANLQFQKISMPTPGLRYWKFQGAKIPSPHPQPFQNDDDEWCRIVISSRVGRIWTKQGIFWGREWVGVHIFWNNTTVFCLAKSFKQQLCLNYYAVLADKHLYMYRIL